MKLRRAIAFCLLIMIMMISTNALADEKLTKGTYRVELVDTIEMEWGQSKAEIKKLMKGMHYEEGSVLGLDAIGYENQPISKFTSYLAYLFIDDSLIGKLYGPLEEQSMSSYYYLVDALTAKYGAPNMNAEDIMKFVKLFTGQTPSKNEIEQVLPSGNSYQMALNGEICYVLEFPSIARVFQAPSW